MWLCIYIDVRIFTLEVRVVIIVSNKFLRKYFGQSNSGYYLKQIFNKELDAQFTTYLSTGNFLDNMKYLLGSIL